MSDESNIIEWGFKGLLGVIVAIGAYLTKNIHGEVVKLRDKQFSLDKDLAAHKLDSEIRFAKDETLQQTLARVHDRIDKMQESMHSGFDEIKTLLINKGGK